ncbi:unnamed protein product [Hymenolepis diminuta]|uniref:PDZ domain-containing protein n=1 Tax=Hymenolepis diminuta TaxID=6216 RepID=A0A0R3SP48_HYMDI|nr:unnamed protein product [Hymenolepis diminuta]
MSYFFISCGTAERAGLRPGDEIVKVNGVNVEEMDHQEVVERIRESQVNMIDQDTSPRYIGHLQLLPLLTISLVYDQQNLRRVDGIF